MSTTTPTPVHLADQTDIALARIAGQQVLKNGYPERADSIISCANSAELVQALLDALDPDTLEAIADEIGSEFKHSARADSLRVIARKQRAAIARPEGGVNAPDQILTTNGKTNECWHAHGCDVRDENGLRVLTATNPADAALAGAAPTMRGALLRIRRKTASMPGMAEVFGIAADAIAETRVCAS